MARTLFWIAPVPTPYLDYLWRHVTKAIPSTTVVLKNHASGGHPWKSKMGEGYRTVCADKKGFDWSIVRLAKDRDAFFVFAGWQSFTFIALLSLLRILGRDYILWTDTPNPVRSGSWLKEKLRSAWVRWIFAGARAVLSTSAVRLPRGTTATSRSCVFVLPTGTETSTSGTAGSASIQ